MKNINEIALTAKTKTAIAQCTAPHEIKDLIQFGIGSDEHFIMEVSFFAESVDANFNATLKIDCATGATCINNDEECKIAEIEAATLDIIERLKALI